MVFILDGVVQLRKLLMNNKEFSYCIGTSDKDGYISCYMCYNSQVFFGTIEEAKQTLAQISNQSNNWSYKIYKLVEMK